MGHSGESNLYSSTDVWTIVSRMRLLAIWVMRLSKALLVIATYVFNASEHSTDVEEGWQRWLAWTGYVLLFAIDFLSCLGQVT